MTWRQFLVMFGSCVLSSLGCQRLPEQPVPGSDDEGSTGIPFPTDDGNPTADSTGGEHVDPTVCVPGLTALASGDLSSLAGVETVEGMLQLDDATNDDLRWLQCVRHIDGDLFITDNPTLSTLAGLERLETLTGQIWIGRSQALLELDALSGLSDLGDVTISENQSLSSIDGLANLTGVGRLVIASNPVLERIELPVLHTAEMVHTSDNVALETLDLPVLSQVDVSVTVANSPLTDLTGLSGLEMTGGSISLVELNDLTDVSDLSSLREVNGELCVTECLALEQLTLPALERSHALRVTGNPRLTTIDLPQIQALESIELDGLDALTDPPDLSASEGLLSLTVYSVPQLESLGWVGTLPEPAGSVIVFDAAALSDVAALAGVTHVLGHVRLSQLPSLTSLDDLSSLEVVERDLRLVDLPVTSLAPLSSLTGVGVNPATTGLTIEGLDGLTSLAGLESLTTIGGRLTLVDDPSLADLTALSSITELDELTIANDDALVDLSGLEGVQVISGSLAIRDNAILADLGALWPLPTGSLMGIGLGVEIRENPMLSQCTVDDFVDALVMNGWPGVADVGMNLRCVE